MEPGRPSPPPRIAAASSPAVPRYKGDGSFPLSVAITSLVITDMSITTVKISDATSEPI